MKTISVSAFARVAHQPVTEPLLVTRQDGSVAYVVSPPGRWELAAGVLAEERAAKVAVAGGAPAAKFAATYEGARQALDPTEQARKERAEAQARRDAILKGTHTK